MAGYGKCCTNCDVVAGSRDTAPWPTPTSPSVCPPLTVSLRPTDWHNTVTCRGRGRGRGRGRSTMRSRRQAVAVGKGAGPLRGKREDRY